MQDNKRFVVREDLVDQIIDIMKDNQLSYDAAILVLQVVQRELGAICVIKNDHPSGN